MGRNAAAANGDPSTAAEGAAAEEQGAATELPSASSPASGATALGADGVLLRPSASCLELYFCLFWFLRRIGSEPLGSCQRFGRRTLGRRQRQRRLWERRPKLTPSGDHARTAAPLRGGRARDAAPLRRHTTSPSPALGMSVDASYPVDLAWPWMHFTPWTCKVCTVLVLCRLSELSELGSMYVTIRLVYVFPGGDIFPFLYFWNLYMLCYM
jgi:hypothetical protein